VRGIVRELSFVQWAKENGFVTDADVQAHIHAGLRSAPSTKTFGTWYHQRLTMLQTLRDYAKQEYVKAIESGEITEPRKLSLEEKADGHPDNPSVQAAKRILEKKRIKQESQPNGR